MNNPKQLYEEGEYYECLNLLYSATDQTRKFGVLSVVGVWGMLMMLGVLIGGVWDVSIVVAMAMLFLIPTYFNFPTKQICWVMLRKEVEKNHKVNK